MPLYEKMIEIFGTPEEIQKMLNAGSPTERRFYKKEPVSPGHYRLWYRSERSNELGPPNDLVAAIKRNAGLTVRKPKAKRASTTTDDAADGGESED